MTTISAIAHPSAAAHHVFGSHMPHEWVLALCEASAKTLTDHIDGVGHVKIQPDCQPMVEMLAALGKMLPVGLPALYVDGANMPESSASLSDTIRHDLTGIGFTCFLMTTPIDTGLSIIPAIHVFNRRLAHPSLSGLTAHVVMRGAGAETSRFVDLDTGNKQMLALIEAVAASVLSPAQAA